eukprot:3193079-Rhodomonas_salina.1
MPIRNTRTRVRFDSRVATLVLLAAFVGVASADAVRKSQIKAQLLAGYDTKTPPEPADGLKVELSIALQQFISVNTAAETLEFSAWWRMRWVDPRLIWDDPDVQFMSFGVSQIWRPDLTIYERIGGAILDTGDVTVTVYPGGNCQVSLPRSDKIGCPMMISSFPWDRQRCNFTVGEPPALPVLAVSANTIPVSIRRYHVRGPLVVLHWARPGPPTQTARRVRAAPRRGASRPVPQHAACAATLLWLVSNRAP